MPAREVTLESAAFLDSPLAEGLLQSQISKAEIKQVVDLFLECSYDQVGKAPRFLDPDEMHGIVGHMMPARFARRDPLAPKVLPILRAYLAVLEGKSILSQAFELRESLEATAPILEQAVRTGEAHVHEHAAPQPPQKPFVHKAEKTGRNDPCPCGSGRKFKQCCMR